MRRPAIVTFVLENLGWMIGSLILAVFIWIAATTEQNPVEARRFPQRIPIQIALDEGMTITNTPTRSGQVFLRTQASVWEVLEADDITMRADLTGYAPGTYTIELTVQVATARRVVVEDWQPRQITVSIDRAGEILAEVTADVRSQPPTGFEVTEITFDPPEVRVTGPASQVQRVISASARLNLRDDRNPFTRDIQLAPIDDQGRIVSGVTLTPDTVSVSGNIQPREDYREVFVTPNITGDLPEGYVIHSITYEPQTILVSGRPSALEQLPGTIATAPVDLTGQTTSFSRNVQVELPPGVFFADRADRHRHGEYRRAARQSPLRGPAGASTGTGPFPGSNDHAVSGHAAGHRPAAHSEHADPCRHLHSGRPDRPGTRTSTDHGRAGLQP